MKTLTEILRRPLVAAVLATLLPLTARATVLYDSNGFELPTFVTGQPLENQDPATPAGGGPWRKDAGTSTAQIVAVNPVEGTKSVRISRAAGATGNTRWAVVKPATVTGLNNVIDVHFDMRVLRKANAFGPLFGIEAYDASLGSPKMIGSLLIDAGSGELVRHQAVTGAIKGTGFYPDLVPHHHYRISMNFTDKTCSVHVDGKLIHTEGFVNATATSFTDASLATLAAGPGNDEGTAYVDNYRIEQTTSQLPYLLWQGDGVSNTWSTGGAPNWYDGFAPVPFANGKPARFADGGSAAPAIAVQGSVLPSSITVSSSQNYTLAGSGSIAGTTGLLKQGNGRLVLAAANTYSGPTDLRGGELAVRNTAGSATGSGTVSVFPMCTLSGNGAIGGSLWVASGGIVKPGADNAGTLKVGGILVLDSATLKYDVGSSSDRIEVAGDLTLGGTLEITAASGFAAGVYPLIQYGGTLDAGSLAVTSAPSGYDYRVDTATPGVVNLVVTPPPPPPLAPDGLAAAAAGPRGITLTWNDRSDNEDSFVIERSGDGTAFTTVASAARDATSFADSGLAPGTTYFYRVRATNAGGQSAGSNVASATTDPSPVTAHYEFELTALDSSGNNNHGVIAGGVLFEEGRVGEYAAQFAGTGFVEITRVVETNFTVMMWVKTTGSGGGGAWYNGMGLVDGEMVGSAADWGCSILNSKFALGIGAPDTTISSNRSVNDGQWHHVAATRSSDTGEVKIYIDGVLDNTGFAPTGPRTAPTQLRIGATQTANPVFFVGAMDDLRFYGSRLTAAEIAAAADLPGPPPPPTGDPVVIWPLGDSITWGYTTASAADSPGGYREPLYRNLLLNNHPALKMVGANSANPGPLLTRDGQVNHDGYPQYTLTEINANLDANAPTGKTRGNNGGFWLTGTGTRPALDPDIVLLLAGTNDIEGGTTAALIEQRLDAMVAKIFAKRPDTLILLASIPPYPADANKTATAKAYNQLIRGKTVPKFLALGHDIRFVDQYANFIAASSPAGDVVISGLYGDTIHPNEAGYQLMGDTWAAAILGGPAAPPAAPAELAASAPTFAAVELTWSDLSNDEGAFLIERSVDGGGFQHIGQVAADQTTFRDEAVAPLKSYQYRVRARNTAGDSAYSNVAAVSTPAPPPPAAPAGLLAFGGNGVVRLTWTGSENATGYQIKRATAAGGEPAVIETVSGTTHLDSTVTNGQTYSYLVTALGAGGESAPSNEAVAAPDAFRPLVWSGAVDHRWDDFTTANWRDAGERAALFHQADHALFTDAGNTSRPVEVRGIQNFSSLTVDAAAAYRFGGSGTLAGAGGLVKSGAGTLTLSGHASYGGGTTVNGGTLRLSALAHRWSFNGTLADSAGGRDAVIVDQGAQNAVLSPTAVTLAGGARNDSDYVSLGSHLLPAVNQPVTLEVWASHVATRNFSRIFDFGVDSTENLFMGWTVGTTLASDRVEWRGPAGTATRDNSNQPYALGTEYHIVMVIEPGAGTDGTTRVTWYSAPAGNPELGAPRGSFETANTLAAFNDANAWLGRSAWAGDETASASYNEMRIWRRGFTAAGLQALHAAGPDADLTGIAPGPGSQAAPLLTVLPPATAVELAGGALEIETGMNQPVGSLAGAAGTAVRLVSGSLTVGGDDTSTVFAGAVTGAGSLTKTGAGTLVLAGPNSYGGATTVSGGTLRIDGDQSAAAGTVTVRDGATLGGTGTTGGIVALESGGTLSPGASVGTLATGANVWQGGSAYRWEIADAQAGGDLLEITGGLTLDASAAAPVTVRVRPAGSAVANLAAGSPTTWKIVTTSAGISGFAENAVAIDATGFPRAGTFSLALANGGKDLELTFTPAAGYDGWARLRFSAAQLADPAIAGRLADPDHDGIRNLEEYAFGGDPTTPDRGILPVAELSDGHLVLHFTRILDRPDLTYTVQAGADLVDFTAVARSVAGGATVALNGGVVQATPDPAAPDRETVSVRDATPVSSATRRFMRVEIVGTE